MTVDEAKDEVLAACRELVDKGLVSRTWGNISFRIDGRRMALTPSGVGYDRLTRREIVAVDLETLGFEGGLKPSAEKGIHALVYRKFPNVNCVIHTHQRGATVLATAGFGALAGLSAEERAALGGPPVLAAYALPGTKRLVRNVEAALAGGARTALLARHGALLCGVDRAEAFTRAEALEAACLARLVLPPAPEGGAEVFSARAEDGGFVFTSCGNSRVWGPGERADQWPASLHQEIYRRYPGFCHILHWASPAALRVLAAAAAKGRRAALPAMLDDFAQMAGPAARIAPLGLERPEDIRRAAKLLGGGNCLGVTGLGFLCCAASVRDGTALLSLLEKNSLAFLQGEGRAKPLSRLDRLLMRAVYLHKYSKKI